MYRIELSPGEETAFRTIDELAVAIRRGVVTSKARIWHNASSKWLPIQFHPHYRQAAEMPLTQADLVAGPPVAPLASLSLPDPYSPESRVTGFRPTDPSPPAPPPAPQRRVAPLKPPASPYHQPEPQLPPSLVSGLPLIEPLGGAVSMPAPARPQPARLQPAGPAAAAPKPAPVAHPPRRPAAMKAALPEEPRSKKKSRGRKSSRRALRAALVGALLIGGAHLGVSASGALSREGLRSYRRLVAVAQSPQATESDSPRTVAAVLPALRNSSVPGVSKRPHRSSRPPAPTLRTPAPTLDAVTKASLPMMSAPAESTPEIQAAPAVEIPVPKVATPDSLSSAVRDTTGKKVLKGILKAVSGSAPSEQRPQKR
jgi:hypothetical protein